MKGGHDLIGQNVVDHKRVDENIGTQILQWVVGSSRDCVLPFNRAVPRWNQQGETCPIARHVHRMRVQHRYQDQNAEHIWFPKEKVTQTGGIVGLLAGVGRTHRQGNIERHREGGYLSVLAIDGLDQLGNVGLQRRAQEVRLLQPARMA